MSQFVYPPTPQHIDEKLSQPSSAFKKEVTKVLAAIIFFIAVYIVLMAAAILLALLCGYGGIMLIAALPRFFTLMIGLGLIGLGGMVIFFLLKFLFKQNKSDRSHLVEITQDEQPELFAFIRKLTKETGSPFPKKIYLSPDVNACVFYNSSFWSMFFPIRKNLQIGLGLVNAVNLSEFKAIMAHEFGHFSQRSMKLGSYVYNVNQVIYNMLYDNEGYGQTLVGWANISGYFAFFANITVKIVEGIQYILQQVYKVVNKNYMSLSRQMEFHADTVSAVVSGSNHLVTSLRRLEVADLCYNTLFNNYNTWYSQNLKPDNIYVQHTEVMKYFAKDHQLPIVHDLPEVSRKSFTKFNKSRIVVKDQWASHPSNDDREDHLNSLGINTETVHTSAWAIFRDAEALQKKITDHVYRVVTFHTPPVIMDIAAFREKFTVQLEKYKLNEAYKSFFDNRNISPVIFNVFKTSTTDNEANLDSVLTEDNLSLPYIVNGLKSDIELLENILKHDEIKTFEFDGEKKTTDDVPALIGLLKEELRQKESNLVNTDHNIIRYFLAQAEKHGQRQKLQEDYEKLFSIDKESSADQEEVIRIQNIVSPIYHGSMPVEEAYAITNQIKLKEPFLKERLTHFKNDEVTAATFTDEEKKKIDDYINASFSYFSQSTFHDKELTLFNEAVFLFQSAATDRSFNCKKELLDWQLSLAS